MDVGKRGLFLPLGHHGDEGRGRVRIPVLIENFCPVIGWKGLDFTSLSGTLVCTKFVFFILLTVTRHFNYPSYQFNVLRLIIFSRKFNVYFALSKEYVLKVIAH